MIYLSSLFLFIMYFHDDFKTSKARPCCVPGCKNRHSKRHRFPKKEPEIFDAWVRRIKPANYEVLTMQEMYNKYVVCEEHFSEDCIVPGIRGLKRTAIPSLNIPGTLGDSVQESLSAVPSCSTLIPGTESTSKKAKLDRPTLGPASELVKQALYTLSTLKRKPLEASSIPGSTNTGSLKGTGFGEVDYQAAASENGYVFLEKPIQTISCDKKCQFQKDSIQSSCTPDIFYSKRGKGKLINFTEDFQNDTSHDPDESNVHKIEWAGQGTSDDISDQNSMPSDDDSTLASTITNGSDFVLRKEMFKQFVIKIIDEITNEKDLNVLKDMFAQVVPLPKHIQGNVKTS